MADTHVPSQSDSLMIEAQYVKYEHQVLRLQITLKLPHPLLFHKFLFLFAQKLLHTHWKIEHSMVYTPRTATLSPPTPPSPIPFSSIPHFFLLPFPLPPAMAFHDYFLP